VGNARLLRMPCGRHRGGSFDSTARTLEERLAARPAFYRGSVATLIVDGEPPEAAAFAAFVGVVREHGIDVRGYYGDAAAAALAAPSGIPFLGAPARPVASVADIAQRRVARADAAAITPAARSLDADFAGARADLAQRRKTRTVKVTAVAVRSAPRGIDAAVTRYYRGTVRGGQSIQQVGNIVVVGDVNPGAELIASGDVVVFGTLRGTAHAGAQGDRGARVTALQLAATQLRIATCIAAGDDARKREPEEARIEGDRIVIVPLIGPRV
jgi:septum site-determining protein MinC